MNELELVSQFEEFLRTREKVVNALAWRDRFVQSMHTLSEANIPYGGGMFASYSEDSFDIAWANAAAGRVLVFQIRETNWSMYWVDGSKGHVEVVNPTLRQVNDQGRWFFGERIVPRLVAG